MVKGPPAGRVVNRDFHRVRVSREMLQYSPDVLVHLEAIKQCRLSVTHKEVD